MLSDTLTEFLHRIPKMNLHVHIEGTIQLQTLLDIAGKNNYLSELTPRQAEILSKGSFAYTDFPGFIDTYSLCANALRAEEDYERIVYEYLTASHRLNVRYVEIYVSPYDRMRRGLSFQRIMAGVFAGQRRAENETGILSSIVVDVGRHLLWTTDMNPDTARSESVKLVETIVQYKQPGGGIVGFSLGGKEIGLPVYPFVDAFNLARANGLHVKAHSGESIDTGDMWYVVGLLKAERIGNSVHAVDDRGLLHYLKENNIAIELCPTGNVLTGAVSSLGHLPFRKIFDEGIPVVIGDDDPALFNTDIQKEYEIIAEQFGLSADELERLVISMVDISWLDQPRKRNLREGILTEIRGIREDLGL